MVYLGGGTVERPLTDKEKSQLLDVHEDWGAELIGSIWVWDGGGRHHPYSQLLVEFLLSGYGWLTGDTNELGMDPIGERIKELIEAFDWTQTRLPGLSVVTTDPLVSPWSM